MTLLQGISAGNSSLDAGAGIGTVQGMPEQDNRILRRLMRVWADKYPGNRRRSMYYDAKEPLKDFGIAVPPRIRSSVHAPLGWPRLAVRALADKTRLEGLSVDGEDTLGIGGMFDDLRLDSVLSEAVVSAYKHSCAFLTIDHDPSDPTGRRVQILPRGADWSAALWDNEHMRISAAMTITSSDDQGMIDGLNLWLPGRNWHCEKTQGAWRGVMQATGLDRVVVVPIVYDRQMDRPFGRSRITRALMAQTDAGYRTMVLMETDAQYYSAPKMWILDASPGLVRRLKQGNPWSSLASAINGISRDDQNPDTKPTIQQLNQASMTPLGDMMQTIAMLVSSETGVPAERLGVQLANPTSADALAASENDLTRIAERQNADFGHAVMQALALAIQLRDNTNDIPDLSRVRPVWAPTRVVSDGVRSDFYTKVGGLLPAYADSDVGLYRLGLTSREIQSLRASERQQRAQAAVDKITAQVKLAGQQRQEQREALNAQQQQQDAATGAPLSEQSEQEPAD